MPYDGGLRNDKAPRVFLIQSAKYPTKLLMVSETGGLTVGDGDKATKATDDHFQFRVYQVVGHIQNVRKDAAGFLTRNPNPGGVVTLGLRANPPDIGQSPPVDLLGQHWYFGHAGKYTFIVTEADADDVVSVLTLAVDGSIVVRPLEDGLAPPDQLWLFIYLRGVQ